MSPAANNSKTGDWVKWAVGITWGAMAALVSYVVSNEHRLTATETTVASHDIRLKQQSDDTAKILAAMTDVQVKVGTIMGYLQRPKPPQE